MRSIFKSALVAVMLTAASAIQIQNMLYSAQEGSPSHIALQILNDPKDVNTKEVFVSIALPEAIKGEWKNPACQLAENSGEKGTYEPISNSSHAIIKMVDNQPRLEAKFSLANAPSVGQHEVLCIVEAPIEAASTEGKTYETRYDNIGVGGTKTAQPFKFPFSFSKTPRLASTLQLQSSLNNQDVGNGFHSTLTNFKLPPNSTPNDPMGLIFGGANVEYISPLEVNYKAENIPCIATFQQGQEYKTSDAKATLEEGSIYITLTPKLLQNLGIQIEQGINHDSNSYPDDAIKNTLYIDCPEVSAINLPPKVTGYGGALLQQTSKLLSGIYSTLTLNDGKSVTPGLAEYKKLPLSERHTIDDEKTMEAEIGPNASITHLDNNTENRVAAVIAETDTTTTETTTTNPSDHSNHNSHTSHDGHHHGAHTTTRVERTINTEKLPELTSSSVAIFDKSSHSYVAITLVAGSIIGAILAEVVNPL